MSDELRYDPRAWHIAVVDALAVCARLKKRSDGHAARLKNPKSSKTAIAALAEFEGAMKVYRTLLPIFWEGEEVMPDDAPELLLDAYIKWESF